MRENRIGLETLTPMGHVQTQCNGQELSVRVTEAIHDLGYNINRSVIRSYLAIPGVYRPPFRIEMTVKLDMPCFILLAGEGHVTFGSPWMENRRIEDIAVPMGKPREYDNEISFGEHNRLSVYYGLHEMQILVDGEERFFSNHERYFKASHEEGYALGITCTKDAELEIREIVITELDADIGLNRPNTAKPLPDLMDGIKPTYESCIAGLPEEIQAEIGETERFLKALKPMKFRRAIDKNGKKITYVASDFGISYALYISGSQMHHSLQWYIVTNGKPETWHRRANHMEEVLQRLDSTNPELAGRIFHRLNECTGCRRSCSVFTPYEYHGQRKTTCHGQVFLKMKAADFQDARDFFEAVNGMHAENE